MQKIINQRRKLTRKEARSLDVEIAFLEGLHARSPEYVDVLRLLGLVYSQRGRYEDALRVDEELARLVPHDPRVFYNLACSYSLAHQPDESITALGRALNRGYHDYRWILKDPDLANARRHPLFRFISERIQRCWQEAA
jgi:tetratricopeptide (TPR) repeat protein